MACIFTLCCPKDSAISPETDDPDNTTTLLNGQGLTKNYGSNAKVDAIAVETLEAARSTPPSPAAGEPSLLEKQKLVVTVHKTLTLTQQQTVIERLSASTDSIEGLSECSEFSGMQSPVHSNTLQQLKALTEHCRTAWSIIERATNDPTRINSIDPLTKSERVSSFCSKLEPEDGSPTQSKDESLVAAFLSLTSADKEAILSRLNTRIQNVRQKIKSFETTSVTASPDEISVGCSSKQSTTTPVHPISKVKSISPWTLNNMRTKAEELIRCQSLLMQLSNTCLLAQKAWKVIDAAGAMHISTSLRVEKLINYILSIQMEQVE